MLLAFLAPVIAAGTTFTCTPVLVWDGDGPVLCAEGPKLRLAGIAARETNETCRRYQPCPNATAAAAREALVRQLGGPRGRTPDHHVRVRGPRLTCLSWGEARRDRTAATCSFPDGRDLGCAMLATGTVLRWNRYWRGPRC